MTQPRQRLLASAKETEGWNKEEETDLRAKSLRSGPTKVYSKCKLGPAASLKQVKNGTVDGLSLGS